ncbi:MAG: anti-sigma factor family protein [Candidatus Aminicenantia bacterium]
MKCDEIKNLITLFVEGELDEEKSKVVKEHIDSCEKCKILEMDIIETLHSLHSMKLLPVPERVVEKIIEKTSRKKRRFSFSPVFQLQWVFAFSFFIFSFLFFTYPKRALLFDTIELKTLRAYSHAVRFISKIEVVVDYIGILDHKSHSGFRERSEKGREKGEVQEKLKLSENGGRTRIIVIYGGKR